MGLPDTKFELMKTLLVTDLTIFGLSKLDHGLIWYNH